jgi:gluconolactonase
MKRQIILLLSTATIAASLASADAVRPAGAQPRSEGEVGAGEGPVWHPSGNLYFTGGDRISRRDSKGAVAVFREPSGGANGLLFDHNGRLVVCESGKRRLTRTEPDGTIIVLTDNYQGQRYNTPNDLTVDSQGRIYFTDPRYGSREGMEVRDERGMLVEGVYRVDAPGKVTRIITHEVDRPNGILVTPDDRYLYVADNNNNNTVGAARKLWRFDLKLGGVIVPSSRKLIFDWEYGRGPDGFKMDRKGRLYVAAGLNVSNPPYESAAKFKGGIYILSAAGKLLDFVAIPKDEVTNCAFGGEEWKTLFITAGGTLWSVRVNTPGQSAFNGGAK